MTLLDGADTACLLGEDGTRISLDVRSWSAPADAVELRQLAQVRGPVLDLGCGPGRLVVALAERGVPALGVDASPAAVRHARDRQAPALTRSVFDHIPGTGRWTTALLFDGNVGIGGDPERLLSRVSDLLDPTGRAIVEVAPPGSETRSFPARVQRGAECSAWFPWAVVGVDAIADLARSAGLDHADTDTDQGRWFADLRPSR